jgi:hypothetical protein
MSSLRLNMLTIRKDEPDNWRKYIPTRIRLQLSPISSGAGVGPVSSDARLKAAGLTLTANLSAVEEAVYQVRNQSGQDPLNFPIKTNNRLAALLTVVNRGDGKPVGNAIPIFDDLIRELRAQTDRFAAVLAKDLAAFNVEVGRLRLDAVK